MHVYLNTVKNLYEYHDLNTVGRCTFNKYSTTEACLENKNTETGIPLRFNRTTNGHNDIHSS